MKKFIAVLLVAMLLVGLTACGGSSTEPASTDSSGDNVIHVRIGAQTYSMAEEASSWMIKGMQRALDDYEGVEGEVIVSDPEADISKQVAGIEEFIQADLDGMIISSVDALGVVSSLQAAQDAGIVVVPFDLDPDWNNAPCVVVADDHKGGFLAGDYLAKYLIDHGITEGTILVQKTRPSITACVERSEGYEEALANYPQFTVQTFLADPGGRSGWLAATENMLQAYPDAVAVCCFDGDSTMAGVLAVESQHRDEVLVTGYFPGVEVCQAAVDGRNLICVVDSDAEGMSYTAMTKCLDIITGKTVDTKVTTEVKLLDVEGCQAWLDSHKQ